jgi:hypothetical protein
VSESGRLGPGGRHGVAHGVHPREDKQRGDDAEVVRPRRTLHSDDGDPAHAAAGRYHSEASMIFQILPSSPVGVKFPVMA